MTVIIEKRGKFDHDFDNILWALKARSTDNTRIAIQGMYVDDGMIVCTDGHRLHCYLTDRELENGNYTVNSANRKQVILTKNDYIFPDYQRVFPKTEFCQPFHCNGKKFRLLHEVYKNYTGNNETFDNELLEDCYMENSDVMISKDMNHVFSPLVIYDGKNRTAIVMPHKLV